MTAESFKQLFIPHYKKMYCVAFKIMNNDVEAQDAVQNALLKLWDKRDTLTSINNVEAYCMGVIKNICLDSIRARHNIFSNIDDYSPQSGPYSEDKSVEQGETLKCVSTIIDKLPPQQKEVIRLRCFDDLSLQEIEQATGLTNMNIRTLISRARKKIKEEYSKLVTEYEYGQ